MLINSDYSATCPPSASRSRRSAKYTDIKILLGSHAHADHMEGDALVKQLTARR